MDPAHADHNPGFVDVIRDKAEGRKPVHVPTEVTMAPRPRRHMVAIRASLTSWTGYGQIAEWLGRGLEGLGISVGYEDMGSDERYFGRADWTVERTVSRSSRDWLITLATPHHKPPVDRRVLAFSMWETDGLASEAVANLNRAHAVIVPCEFNRKSFLAAGVTRPIFVAPLGVSAEEGYRDDGTAPPSDVCRFGMAGRMSHGGSRKGINEGMAAFVDAFPPSVRDVALEVKCWEDCLPLLRVPSDPRIKIVTSPMKPPEMAAWYRSLTALFVPSKGEGWGLHTHQAMACGRPVIAARWSGTADFWDERFGWALEYDLKPAGEFYAGQGRWAVPRHEAMVEALRYVYGNRGEAEEKGRDAARRAAEFTWERTATAVRAAIVESGVTERGANQKAQNEPNGPTYETIPLAETLAISARIKECPSWSKGPCSCGVDRCARGKGRNGEVNWHDCRACLAEQDASRNISVHNGKLMDAGNPCTPSGNYPLMG